MCLYTHMAPSRKHIFFGFLVFLGLLSFWLTHRTTQLNPYQPPGRNGLNSWFDSFTSTDSSTMEKNLRTATDSMDLVKLRTAIGAARQTGVESAALRTAIFVHDHLSEAHAVEIRDLAEKAGHASTTAAAASDGVSLSETKNEQTTPTAPKPPQLPVPVKVKPIPSGTPQNFDWWKDPPSSLAPLLPKMPAAALFERPVDDALAQKRHDAILALASSEYQPSNFPIGIVAYNRPELLKLSLESLLQVRGITKSQITLYQDGQDGAVKSVADEFGIAVKQHLGNQNTVGQEGAAQIARHYKWTFSSLFNDNPNAEYAIVVEDDMIFSNDFLSYFVQLAPLYAKDPSIYCITSWNDNAQAGLAADPRVMLRTDFFIGLGWMISRKIYKNEFEGIWPNTHWDHWLRDPLQRKHRQCVFPEVPRNYNIGKRGTHSDDSMYAQYFERIVLNKQPAVWLGNIDRLLSQNYEAMTYTRIQNALQLSSMDAVEDHAFTDIVLFLEISAPEDKRWEKYYAPYFGLWHSVPYIRGQYLQGFLYLRWRTNYLMLITTNAPNFVKFRNQGTTVLNEISFRVKLESLLIVQALPGGENCHEACRRQNEGSTRYICSKAALQRINECNVMQSHFTCTRCEMNWGIDQPALVSKEGLPNYGFCLVNSHEPECGGGHADTTRLCACVPA